MTIPSTPRKAGPLLGNGVTTSFPFAFKVFAAADLKVVTADSTGAETVLVLNTDFSVTLNANQDTSPGGTITYPLSGAPLPSGSRITAVGNLNYDQPLDLPTGGNFSPTALENQLDRATMQVQQLKEEVDRSAKMPVSYSTEDMEQFTAGVIALADSVDDIATVAGSIGAVNAVADNMDDIGTVAGIAPEVTAVATSTAVQVVAADLGGVRFTNDLGLITDPVTDPGATAPGAIIQVAVHIDDVQAVSAVADDIAVVAPIASDVSAVASISTDVSVVADNVTGVSTFAAVWQGAHPTDPTVRNDGSALQPGDLYFNEANDVMRVYGTTGWADSVEPASVSITTQRFSGNGATTTFTLSTTPPFAAACDVYIAGVAQVVTVDFNVLGSSLVFTTAPPSGTNNIYVKTVSAIIGAVPPDGSVTAAKLASIVDLGVLP